MTFRLFSITIFMLFPCLIALQDNNQELSADELLLNAQKLYPTNKSKALECCSLGVELAERGGSKQLLANFIYTKAQIFDHFAEYDSSFVCYQKCVPLFLAVSDSLLAAKCFINLGVTHYYYGRYDSALTAYAQASDCLRNSRDTLLTAKVFNNLGLVNKSLGYYTEAIVNFQNVISLLEGTSHVLNLANAYFNAGILYWEQRNLKAALCNLTFATQIYERVDSKEDMANAFINLGLVYSNMLDSVKAIEYFDKSIEISRLIGNKNTLASALVNKAASLESKENLPAVIELLHEALKLYEQTNYRLGAFVCYSNLCKHYALSGQNHKAIESAHRALEIKDIDKPVKYVAESYLVLARTFYAMRNFVQASHFFDKYVQLKDSVFSLKINEQITEIQTRYETEKKEVMLQNLQQKLEISDLQLKSEKRRIQFVLLLAFMVFVSSVVFIVLYIQKRKSYLDLVQQNIKLAKSDMENEQRLISQTMTLVDTETKEPESSLSPEHRAELLHNLMVAMEKDKSFLIDSLTITDLAKKLNSNRNYLSQIINEHFKTNFNNFINEYRIREARKMLLSKEFSNLTIEGIAQTVGFNSKASFNTAFKKFTGVTPSFFRDNSQKFNNEEFRVMKAVS